MVEQGRQSDHNGRLQDQTRQEQPAKAEAKMRTGRRLLAAALLFASPNFLSTDAQQRLAEDVIKQKPEPITVALTTEPTPTLLPSPSKLKTVAPEPSASVAAAPSEKAAQPPKPAESKAEKKPENATTINRSLFMKLIASAENSTPTPQYGFIKNIGDGRGWTAGIIGFTSASEEGSSDMLDLVRRYQTLKPENNVLAKYINKLADNDNTEETKGLGDDFVEAWEKAAKDPLFRKAQDEVNDRLYLNPTKKLAKELGITSPLGVFCLYDAAVMHGVEDQTGLKSIITKVDATPPKKGGTEKGYLDAFLDARIANMKEDGHEDNTDRVTNMQKKFLKQGNLKLHGTLSFTVNETNITIPQTS